jgi:hypothetical protein
MKEKLDTLKNSLPPIIARSKIGKYLGGMLSSRYLQNLDAAGRGPERIRLGGKVGYLREDLVRWLEERSNV